MRVGGSLRQILLVALTALAAVTVGQWLRQTVDRANTPPPAQSTVPSDAPTSSDMPSPSS